MAEVLVFSLFHATVYTKNTPNPPQAPIWRTFLKAKKTCDEYNAAPDNKFGGKLVKRYVDEKDIDNFDFMKKQLLGWQDVTTDDATALRVEERLGGVGEEKRPILFSGFAHTAQQPRRAGNK